MLNKLYLCAAFITSTIIEIPAQKTTLSTGGNNSGTGGTVSYSVGQLVYYSQSGTTGSVNQGVQQPFEISIVGVADDLSETRIIYSVYPNPATNCIYLKTENKNGESDAVYFELTDNTGKVLAENKLIATEERIDMQSYANAIYFLSVRKNNKLIKTFKIIKNN